MGQGSRGGNGGVTSSGGRMREDKALKEAEKNPKTVSNKEKEKKAEDKNKDKKKDNNQGGNGGRGGRGGRGRGGLRLFRFPHFRGRGSSAKSGSKSGSGFKKANTPASNIQNKNKIPTIKRVQGPKVKLTKQRSNKAPN